VDNEELHLLKVGRSYLEASISKEKTKSLNITIDSLSIAAHSKAPWGDYVFFIHCNKAQTSQASITKPIWLQTIKNTNASCGNGSEPGPVKVQRGGQIISVPLPDFETKMAPKRKFEEAAVEKFKWPVTAFEDFEKDTDDECNASKIPVKKSKPSPAAAPTLVANDIMALAEMGAPTTAGGYAQKREEFLAYLKTGADVPPRVKALVHFFEAHSATAPLDRTIFGDGEATKEALKRLAKEMPEVPFAKVVGTSVSLFANLFYSKPVEVPKPKPKPKPVEFDISNIF
jgi:hypothetical protein